MGVVSVQMMRFQCKKRTIVTALTGGCAAARDISLISNRLQNRIFCMGAVCNRQFMRKTSL